MQQDVAKDVRNAQDESDPKLTLDDKLPSILSSSSSDLSRATIRLEIYRITAELLSKLALPLVLIVAAVMFQPTIKALITRTTEVQIAGYAIKFGEEASKLLGEAAKTGDLKPVKALVDRIAITSELLDAFLWPGADRSKAPRAENVTMLRNWIDSQEEISGLAIQKFLDHPDLVDFRERAIQQLGIRH